jgi:hypothetical protein
MRSPTPKESKVQTNKPNSPHFLWWHTKYQKEKICLPTKKPIPIEISTKSVL